MTRPNTAALVLALVLAFTAGAFFESSLHRGDVDRYQRQIETLSQALEDASN